MKPYRTSRPVVRLGTPLPIGQLAAGSCRTQHTWRWLMFVAALAAALAAAVAAPLTPRAATVEGASMPRVLPQLLKEAAARPAEPFRVIVTRLNRDTNADRAVAALGGRKIKEVAAEAFVAELPGAAVSVVGANPAVKYVAPDARMAATGTVDASRLATLYDQAVHATALWSTSVKANVTGAGVGVAILDSGISGAADFNSGGAGASRVIANVVFNAVAHVVGDTSDGYGHGTHVAGIVGGNSWWSGTAAVQGKYVGVAPNVSLLNVKVSDNAGLTYLSDVVNAVDWVVANRERFNIRVLNLSLISTVPESYKTSTLAAAVERAWFAGILVVVSAGNQGRDAMLYPPANDPFVVTVGAADPMGTASPSDDTVAPWSSYGVSQDGVSKPDVVAPGRYIVSNLASRVATLATQYPDRVVDGQYLRLSGTSMAAPVVAGIAALAFERHPEWTNDQVKWLLLATATRLGALPGQGAGEADAAAVVDYRGTPGHANQGLAISEHLVGPGGARTYDSANASSTTSSWSTSSWSTSSWSTANQSTSSWSTSSWSTSSWSTSSWSTAVGVE